MAVTRINNNQITDAANGNVLVGINAGTKLQPFSITATRIANNLTYGSDLTIAGNLTVSGTTTNVDTVNTLIQDPLITLADGQTSGAPTLDIGTIGLRGSQNSAVLAWKESALEFVTALSNTTVSNTTFNINSYANLHTGNFTVQGTTSLVGNIIGAVNATDTITGGNLATAGTASAGGNVTGGNLLTGGLVSATGNATAGNVLTGGLVSATANITGGNVLTGGLISATGNITSGANISGANITTGGLISATSTITSAANISGANITTGGEVSAAATITGGNLATGGTASAGGNITGANLLTGGLVSATATITGGNLATGGTASATGNITGGNILTGGLISATGNINSAANITGANVLTGGSVSATSNVTGGNLVSATVTNPTAMTVSTNAGNINLSPAGNIVLNTTYINGLQLTPVQDADAASKYYVDTIATTGITIHEAVFAATISNLAVATGGTVTYAQPNGVANGVGATLTTTGSYTVIDTANVQTVGTRILVKDQANAVQNGVYVFSNATVITRSTDTDQYGADSAESFSINDYFFTTSGNVNAGTAFVVSAPPGVITFGTSNIEFGIFSQSQVYSANTQAGLILNGTVFSAKVDNNTTAFDGGGNISVKTSANLTTPNIGAATGTSLSTTGTITGGNLATGGTASVGGNITGANILTGGLISATATITGGNLATGGTASATGNITGGNILSGGLGSFTGNVTAANFFGNISGNIDAAGANTQVQFNDVGDILGASAGFTFDKTANLLTVGGNVGAVNFNGNVYGTSVSASGTVTAASTVGGVITGTSASVTGTVTAASTVGGVITGSNVSVTGNITSANLILTTGIVDGPAAGRVTVNGSGIDTDFAVDGDTLANVFYVDAGTGTASFGNSTQITNSLVSLNTTASFVIPRGNIAQRPATGVTGMMRFNSTTNSLEIYNNTDWIGVGSTVFTVITDQQFNGDGVNVAFTLSNASTTASTIVSINGVLQIPTSAYSVANVTLTFTEAPASGDLIDVRALTTTSTLTNIQNVSGNASIAVSDTSATTTITGDLTVTGNATVLGAVATDQILNGTSKIEIPDPNQDIHFDINGQNEVVLVGQFDSRFTGNINPGANVTYNLGNTANRWNTVWASSVSAVGNITGGNLSVGTGTVTVGNIVNANGNGVGNIGSSSLYFNTVFAKATSAQYADLAEKYTADAEYAAGTVLVFGGTAEVTVNAVAGDTKVAGVVSTNPSYTMNSGLESEHVATVALTGRVPTLVVGPVRKGDLMVAAGLGRAQSAVDPRVGSVIGKALEDFDGSEGTIEVVVGRF